MLLAKYIVSLNQACNLCGTPASHYADWWGIPRVAATRFSFLGWNIALVETYRSWQYHGLCNICFICTSTCSAHQWRHKDSPYKHQIPRDQLQKKPDLSKVEGLVHYFLLVLALPDGAFAVDNIVMLLLWGVLRDFILLPVQFNIYTQQLGKIAQNTILLHFHLYGIVLHLDTIMISYPYITEEQNVSFAMGAGGGGWQLKIRGKLQAIIFSHIHLKDCIMSTISYHRKAYMGGKNVLNRFKSNSTAEFSISSKQCGLAKVSGTCKPIMEEKDKKSLFTYYHVTSPFHHKPPIYRLNIVSGAWHAMGM